MKLFPGSREEYQRRHNPIWPELAAVLKEHGVRDYSIFIDDDSHLFACAVVESEERWAAIADTEVCRRWWKHMSALMYTNDDGSPVSTDLTQVFNLE